MLATTSRRGREISRKMGLTGVISDFDSAASSLVAIAKDAKVGVFEGAKRNGLYDWSGQHRDQEHNECAEKQHRQRCRGAQHGERQARSVPWPVPWSCTVVWLRGVVFVVAGVLKTRRGVGGAPRFSGCRTSGPCLAVTAGHSTIGCRKKWNECDCCRRHGTQVGLQEGGVGNVIVLCRAAFEATGS